MIRNIRYRKAVIRPAVVICRARRHVERAASTTTSNTEAVASSSNIASTGADKRTSPKPVEKGVLAVKQMQWMPSVAHRTSATALRREKVIPSPSHILVWFVQSCFPLLIPTCLLYFSIYKMYTKLKFFFFLNCRHRGW